MAEMRLRSRDRIRIYAGRRLVISRGTFLNEQRKASAMWTKLPPIGDPS
jgi:hypothetical protein